MTGQLYTDQEAPPNLRGAAQGFITFVTYGVGMFTGSLLSGVAVDYFTTTTGTTVTRNWNGFWLSSSAGAFLILMLVAAFFRSHNKIQTD
jgi:MFS family permease